MPRVVELDGLLIVIRFPADIVPKKREGDLSFGADDLAGICRLIFGDIKAPGAINNHFIFK